MPSDITRRLVLSIPAAVATVALAPAQAATYPSRTTSLVVPYGTGGGTDIVARIIADGLGKTLKTSVIVENKPGASGIVGTEFVKKAAPNGYTLLFAAINMAISPAIFSNLPYDAARDFTPIAQIGTSPLFVIVKASSPIKSIHDLVAYAKAHPEKANFASASGVFWLASELFAQQTGMKLTRVPYKGAGAMALAVASGEVLFAIPSAPPVIGQAHAGAIRVLATTAPNRMAAFPNVPTMAEAGVPGVVVEGWHGIWAPSHTPQMVIDTIAKAVHEVLHMPEVEERLKKLNEDIANSTPDEFKKMIAAQTMQWKRVAKKAHISVKL